MQTNDTQPDAVTLAGFAACTLIGGSNLVAVRFSNRGLPPFYGAGVRFALAAALLILYVLIRRIPLPRGKALGANLVFGLLGFTGFYAFGYWALVSLPAVVAGVVTASVPLMTLLLASAQKVERFTWRGLAGAALAIAGIAVMIGSPAGGVISLAAVLAALVSSACDAEAWIFAKRMPPGDPVANNAVAMAFGAVTLLLISLVAGEEWSVPRAGATVASLLYLVVIGSVALFVIYLRTVRRWTASGMSYMFVLMPIVAAVLGTWLLNEEITPGLVAGGLIVLAGVYFGALSSKAASPVPDGG